LTSWPRISIVTPSFNQGRFIKETIDSVLAQGYPNLEHIVVDGASTDETPSILGRYSHILVISEPDRGQAEAINKGFRLATGDIWGFLNSDDTLLPDALIRVAKAMGNGPGPDVVMGRCRFVDEEGRFIGIEHPSHFESHLRVLRVWKGHFIPQPAVFWRRSVWEKCGGVDEGLGSQWIDYDLFCRFSKWYHFEKVNQVLATYRLHTHSKSVQSSEGDRLEEAIQISRRYWGPVSSPQLWKLAISLIWFRLDRIGRARRLIATAKEARRHGNTHKAFICAAPALLLAPDVAFYTTLYPSLRRRTLALFGSALDRLRRFSRMDPRTAVYLDHTDVWEDGRVGPYLVVSQHSEEEVRSVRIGGEVDLSYMRRPFSLIVFANGQEIGREGFEGNGPFSLQCDLMKTVPPGTITIEIRASAWFVPHLFFKNGDFRPISWRFQRISFNESNVSGIL
jgi:glycosyltransferase involved in cell wall biosynthesis